MNNGEKDPLTHAIIGAAMEVHRTLGHGFLEPVYQEALALELADRVVPFEREVEWPVVYTVTDRYAPAARVGFPDAGANGDAVPAHECHAVAH